jgi:hypothetical protein
MVRNENGKSQGEERSAEIQPNVLFQPVMRSFFPGKTCTKDKSEVLISPNDR